MTKLRPPNSVADAVTRIMGVLLIDAVSRAVKRSDAHIRAWSDPDKEACPSVEQAVVMDSLYMASTGLEPPILTVYQAQLVAAVAASPKQQAPARDPRDRMMSAMTEFGDVSRALETAMRDGNLSPRDKLDVCAHAREAIEQLQRLIVELNQGGAHG